MAPQRRTASRTLFLEALESRTAPSATPWVTQNFDTTPAGSMPTGWSQWTNTGATVAVVAHTGQAGSASLDLAASASQGTAHAWYGSPAASADVQVSAAVMLNSLIPAEIVARGSNLNSANATYYALSLTRGLDLQLLSVVNGTTTVLANLASAAWFSDQWVQATLQVQGNSISAQVVRADTGQYLNSSGQWQSAATWVAQATDSSIAQAGLVGFARPGSYSGPLYFDSFSATLLSAPAATTVAESFDTTTPGNLPAGWTQYSSDGSNVFRVSNAAALSGPNGLAAVAGSSTVSARTWLTAAQPADVQVTAAVLVNALIPAQLVARGSNLNTNAPTYYALALTRGLDLQLVSVVNGATTVLGNLTSAAWFTDLWVRATLYVNGNNLRAQVYRPDSAQYLNAAGQWQSTQAWALNLTNTSITQGSFVGLARPSSYLGTITFDDFSVVPANGDSVPPVVQIVGPSAGSTLSGVVNVQAAASDAGTITRVEFYIDNVLRADSLTAPYTWAFDTSTASNGSHTLTVLAYDLAGNIGSASVPITTQNHTALPVPVIPQHYPNIRIAELAYNGGQTLGSVEATLLQNSVDLVVADQAFAQQINALAPNTPQATYINISNIYGSMLVNWLDYANANGIDPESAFYHVTQPTPFTGNSGSSQPVDWFWAVYNGGATLTDVTNAANNGTGFTMGGVGQALYVGYVDPFNLINVQLTAPANAGWSYVLEYPSSVNAAGVPTAWATLPLDTDTSAGLTRSGQLTFVPPSNWRMASVNGSPLYYYVRLRTFSAGTAPVVASLLGADYVQAKGGTSGVIPVFDSGLDINHTGYLTDAEYAVAVAAGDTARFQYQSRLFYGSYGQMRFVTNPSNAAFRQWVVQYATSYLNAQPYASALFVDNSGGNSPVAGIEVAEPTASYTTDYASLLNNIGQAIAPRWILANIAGGGASADAVVQSVQGYFDEFLIRPLAQTYQQFEEVAGDYASFQSLTSPAPYAVLDSLPTNGSPTDPRTEIATLAYYYLLANPATTFLDFYGGFAPSTSWSQHWVQAAAYNIGAAQGPWSVFATGTDAGNSALTYRVYQRSFANALVLYRPLSTDPTGTLTGSLSVGTTLALNGTYRPLQADGTLGTAVTSITLDNGQGAILIKS